MNPLHRDVCGTQTAHKLHRESQNEFNVLSREVPFVVPSELQAPQTCSLRNRRADGITSLLNEETHAGQAGGAQNDVQACHPARSRTEM